MPFGYRQEVDVLLIMCVLECKQEADWAGKRELGSKSKQRRENIVGATTL